LEERLGVIFNEKDLLKTARTHDSYLNEPSGKGQESYERLEFLGDAVLRLVVSERLYLEVKGNEGELSRQRDELVKRESCTKAARKLGLWQHLLLSESERKRPPNPRILAEAYEAVIGAIYLDQGYESAGQFVNRTLESRSGT